MKHLHICLLFLITTGGCLKHDFKEDHLAQQDIRKWIGQSAIKSILPTIENGRTHGNTVGYTISLAGAPRSIKRYFDRVGPIGEMLFNEEGATYPYKAFILEGIALLRNGEIVYVFTLKASETMPDALQADRLFTYSEFTNITDLYVFEYKLEIDTAISTDRSLRLKRVSPVTKKRGQQQN